MRPVAAGSAQVLDALLNARLGAPALNDAKAPVDDLAHLHGGAGDSQPVVDQQAAVREAILAIEEAGKALASVAGANGR